MTEQSSNPIENSTPNPETPKTNEMEIDLMDIFRKIIGIRKTIYKAALVGLVIGVIVSLSIPKQYTVTVTLSPEMSNSKSGGGLSSLAASFLGSGMTTSGTDALNAFLSADIVSSTPFMLELSNMKVPTSKKGEIPLSVYLESQSSPWWSYVIGLPGIMIGGVKSLLINKDNQTETVTNHTNKGTIELTIKEAGKIGLLRKLITASVEKKAAMTEITVTLQDPKVAAVVADSVVKKLQEYIINYRTSKAKEDCNYLKKLFEERQQEYYAVQKQYANYVDSHDNIILQSVRAEQERLQNDMNLTYQVYSQVATQLQVARAKVQEEKPVFAVVEPAVVPLKASGTGLKVYVLVFMFLSVVCTIGWMLIGKRFLEILKKK